MRRALVFGSVGIVLIAVVAGAIIFKNHASSQSAAYSVQVAGAHHSYIVHTPVQYDRSKRYPLVVSFGVASSSASQHEALTGFDAVADSEGFVVAYVQAQDRKWQLAGQGSDVDGAQAIIADIELNYSINGQRVYINGFGDGGTVVLALACQHADQFLGFAVVGSTMDDDIAARCNPMFPIGALFFEGTGDLVNRYQGGSPGVASSTTWSAEKTAAFWAQKDLCTGKPVVSQFPDTLSNGQKVHDLKESWNSCKDNVPVQLYAIELGGHAWPGAKVSRTDPEPAATVINATELIWATLRDYRR